MSQLNCKYCHNKHDGWVRVPDGYGCVEWQHCVCMETNPVDDGQWMKDHAPDVPEPDDEGQPSWEQEWQDFGEVYDDEPTYI